MRRVALVVALLVGYPAVARAQVADRAGFEVHYGIDGAITAAELGLAFAASLIHVDTKQRWDDELVGFDRSVRDNFSAAAASTSDALIVLTVVTPLAANLGQGIDDQAGRRTLLYSETLGATVLLNAVAKYTVQRPRPYSYNPDPAVQRYWKAQGKDAGISFYSGHSALGFAAAVSGSYLFALGTDDKNARAVMWGVEIALATATANLRVVAGKHFYSDVLIGSVAGAAVGFLVPALHADERGIYTPSGREWAAIAGGVVAGTLVSQLLPFPSDVTLPLSDLRARVALAPLATEHGGGLMAVGTF